MPIRHRQLPSFGALLAFEAVARLGSFTSAARELHVSQAAISQKVRELESWLGNELIIRSRPSPVISEDGLMIADSIRSSVTTITRTLDQAKRTHGRQNRVTLATTNTFALYWLGSRIETFYAAHPDLELSLVTTDREITESQIEFDLGVTFAAASPAGYMSTRLFHTDVVAAASPKYLATRPAGLEPAQWEREMLLHLAPEPSMEWSEWLSLVGLPVNEPLRASYYSNYITLVQAMLAGRGVGLGWRQLITPILQSGDLVQIGSRSATSSGAYHLIWNEPANISPPDAIAALRDWFLQHVDG